MTQIQQARKLAPALDTTARAFKAFRGSASTENRFVSSPPWRATCVRSGFRSCMFYMRLESKKHVLTIDCAAVKHIHIQKSMRTRELHPTVCRIQPHTHTKAIMLTWNGHRTC